MDSSTPTDEQLLLAVSDFRKEHPELGLKTCLDQNNLNPKSTNDTTSPLPRDENFKKVTKAAFLDFKKREREFFLTLSPSKLSKISPDADPMYAACHLRQHIEFLLLLKGIKPSFLITHYTDQKIFTEMVEQCLKPVMQTHSLERYGFKLLLIDHPTPTEVHKGFQHGWVLVDALSPVYSTVEKVFITPYKGKKMHEDVVGKALGYPTSQGERDFRAVDYTEMNELAVATKKDVCCVTAYEFSCDAGEADMRALMINYDKCVTACEEVGTLIKIDTEGHPELQRFIERYQGR